MNDPQLRYAHAVWKERSFSRAAAKLNVTQPALSDQVRRLEEELGFTLFYRNARGVEPSIAGRTFLEASETIVTGLTDLAGLAKELRGQPGQVIRIGLNSGLSQVVIPRLAEVFGKGGPNTRLEFVTATNRRIQRLLHQGRLDIGFLFESEIKGSAFKLSWTPVGRSQMVALHPNGHRFAKQDGVVLTELAAERLIFSEPRLGYEASVRESFAALNLTPNVVADCDDIESLKYLVESGVGLAVVPRVVAVRELATGLVYAAPLLPPIFVEVNFVRRPDPLPARAEQAAKTILEAMQQNGGLNG